MPVDAIPAATVVLLRTVDGGAEPGVECLMLRKNRGQSFGGMWVFPGGRVEPGDERPDGPDSGECDDARRAAIRETAEETGLALGAAELVPFAHWTPPPEAPKRYSTWFFVAALPEGLDDVVVDGGEIGDHVWTTPLAALDRHGAGEIELAPPTWVSLHTLAEAMSPADALARARRTPVEFFSTRIVGAESELVALWEGDAGYETGDLEAPGRRRRLFMTDGRWRFEDHD